MYIIKPVYKVAINLEKVMTPTILLRVMNSKGDLPYYTHNSKENSWSHDFLKIIAPYKMQTNSFRNSGR